MKRSIANGAIVILATVFPVGNVSLERSLFRSSDVARAIEEVNDYIRSLAASNVIVFDAYSILADDRGMISKKYAKDEIHLNELGYEALNNELKSILVNLNSNVKQ